LTFGASKVKDKIFGLSKQAIEATPSNSKFCWKQQFQIPYSSISRICRSYIITISKQALPNANDIVSSAQFGYRTGDICYVEYLYALQTATDIQLNFLKSIPAGQSIGLQYLFNNQSIIRV
jgi:cobalt-zinc-cadmium resistance protein CzcA